MQIFVKNILGKTFALQVEPSESIENLKAKIREKEGFSIEEQRLYFNGTQLEEAKKLSDYNIGDEFTVLLWLREKPKYKLLFGGFLLLLLFILSFLINLNTS